MFDEPVLTIKFDDGVGNKTTIKANLIEPTLDDVAKAMRLALLGLGFAPDSVNELFREELEYGNVTIPFTQDEIDSLREDEQFGFEMGGLRYTLKREAE